MNEIVINVQGQSYSVNVQALLAFLNQHGKLFTGQNNNLNEITKTDDRGRTVLNG